MGSWSLRDAIVEYLLSNLKYGVLMMSRIVKRFNLTIPILIYIVFFFISFVMAEETFEINTFLMRSTFKIIGENSIGTVFILGKPCKENPDKAYYILITATHVLANMKGDKATLFLRKKIYNLYEKLPWEISIRKEGKDLWINHPEVDVSAMYIALPIDIDIALLPISILADDETFRFIQVMNCYALAIHFLQKQIKQVFQYCVAVK